MKTFLSRVEIQTTVNVSEHAYVVEQYTSNTVVESQRKQLDFIKKLYGISLSVAMYYQDSLNLHV